MDFGDELSNLVTTAQVTKPSKAVQDADDCEGLALQHESMPSDALFLFIASVI